MYGFSSPAFTSLIISGNDHNVRSLISDLSVSLRNMIEPGNIYISLQIKIGYDLKRITAMNWIAKGFSSMAHTKQGMQIK